jgi:hypothetical protein
MYPLTAIVVPIVLGIKIFLFVFFCSIINGYAHLLEVNPHPAFIDDLQHWLGRSIVDFNSISDGRQMRKRISEEVLPNKNVIAKYWFVRSDKHPCIEIF